MPKCWPVHIFHRKSIVSFTLGIAFGNDAEALQNRVYFLLGILQMYFKTPVLKRLLIEKINEIHHPF
jgi:hypothetical protein